MEFEVYVNHPQYKGTLLIYAIPDCGENEGGLWCEVFRESGFGGFEDDYYTDFCIHPDECDCTDKDAVEEYLQTKLPDIDFFTENVMDTEENRSLSIINHIEKYNTIDFERMPVADALELATWYADYFSDYIRNSL